MPDGSQHTICDSSEKARRINDHLFSLGFALVKRHRPVPHHPGLDRDLVLLRECVEIEGAPPEFTKLKRLIFIVDRMIRAFKDGTLTSERSRWLQ